MDFFSLATVFLSFVWVVLMGCGARVVRPPQERVFMDCLQNMPADELNASAIEECKKAAMELNSECECNQTELEEKE